MCSPSQQEGSHLYRTNIWLKELVTLSSAVSGTANSVEYADQKSDGAA